MKIIKISLFILLTTLFCRTQLNAQTTLLDIDNLSNANIDNFSDADLNSLLTKAAESGISESQIYKIAATKGMPGTEIAKLKNRIQSLSRDNRFAKATGKRDLTDSTLTHFYDSSSQYIPVQKFKNDETIFGSELFTSNSLVFEPNLRIPAPIGYVLGPDDELIISVYGFSEKKYAVPINEQGEIFISNVGPIYISGLTIEEATERIKSKLASTIYKAMNTGKTSVQVSLGKIRSIRVTVIGQAKKPGTFTVSSLTTLYNMLYLCGGPTDMGSYRHIEVIRGNSIKKTADLYDFLTEGNQKDNIILQEGDIVRVPYYKKRVTLTGNVKREGKFEILDNETFSDLLKYSGGFTDTAYRGAVTVERVTGTERKIIDLDASRFNTFKPEGSDMYVVKRLQSEFGNRIVISGSVLRPGPYALTPDLSVKSLVEKAGGLKRDAYTKRIIIFRYFNNKMPTMVSVDLDSVSASGRDISLVKDDSVVVHSIFEFHDNDYVSIEGNIRKPGNILWRENLSLRDLLLSAGGITDSGDSSTIEISRRIKNVNVDKTNHNETQIFNIDIADKNDLTKDILLQPYDIIIVKSLPGYTVQRTVLLLGEVKSPGRYGLQKSGDKISDLFKRAGGFKASADSTSITIRRSAESNLTVAEREKLFQRILNISPDSLSLHPRLKDELYKPYDMISVDLISALSNESSTDNLVLEDGDVLTVNRKSSLVRISGEVYNPTIIPYRENKSLKYYVQQAGNFTPYARKAGALVIYPDGKAASVKHFLWFKSYPSVTPRSEIFVPQKTKTNRQKVSIGEWSVVLSSLALLSNVILNLSK